MDEDKLVNRNSVAMNGTSHEYFSEIINEIKNDAKGSRNAASKNNSIEED